MHVCICICVRVCLHYGVSDLRAQSDPWSWTDGRVVSMSLFVTCVCMRLQVCGRVRVGVGTVVLLQCLVALEFRRSGRDRASIQRQALSRFTRNPWLLLLLGWHPRASVYHTCAKAQHAQAQEHTHGNQLCPVGPSSRPR